MQMHGKKGLNGDGRLLRWFLVPLLPKPLSQRVDCRISKEYDNRSGDVRVYIDVEDIEAEKLKQDDA